MTKSAADTTKIVFRDPAGEWHESPDASWIKRVVTSEGPEFWETGAGEAAIDYYEDQERRAVLYLKSREKYGFVVDYDREGSDEGYYVLRNGEHTGETVAAIVGGDEVAYWREHFVPREVAWEAAEHFLRTGERKGSLTWEIHSAPEAV